MNKTTNYQLNQWERTDKVQMEDFNADNAKIDAAIKAVDAKADTKAAQTALSALSARVDTLSESKAEAAALEAVRASVRYQKLLQVTAEKDTAQIDLDLSSYDLTQFTSIFIYGMLDQSRYILRLDGREAGYYCDNYNTDHLMRGGGDNLGGCTLRLELSGFQERNLLVTAVHVVGEHTSSAMGMCINEGQTIRVLNFIANSDHKKPFKAGSHLTVYGLRK